MGASGGVLMVVLDKVDFYLLIRHSIIFPAKIIYHRFIICSNHAKIDSPKIIQFTDESSENREIHTEISSRANKTKKNGQGKKNDKKNYTSEVTTVICSASGITDAFCS